MIEKYLWKSDILSNDAGDRPAALTEMSLFCRRFSNILLVKTNYLVKITNDINGPLLENRLS